MTTKPKAVQLGQVVFSMAINEHITTNSSFSQFALNSLIRHSSCDWGELCDDDKALNDQALKEGSRLFSSYTIPPSVEIPYQKIWIITEWNRKVTTILFPNEY